MAMGRHGPFGDSGFKAGVIGSAVLVIAGLALTLLTRSDVQSLGASFLALGILGLSTAGAGLLAERVVKRRIPTHWPEGQGGNGFGPDRDYSAGA
jgi:hypothetical protein